MKIQGFFEHYFFFLFIRNARSKNRHWRPCFLGFMSLFTRSPVVKVPQWKKCLCVCVPYSKFDFFPCHSVFPFFKTFLSQFFSHWGSAEPVFCSEDLSSLPCKNQNPTLSGKIQIFCMLRT